MNHYYVLYEKIPHDGANWLTVVSGIRDRVQDNNFVRRPGGEVSEGATHGPEAEPHGKRLVRAAHYAGRRASDRSSTAGNDGC
jgi:hypothetical protein